ncbi:MAG: glycosyltransferase family 39 protein [Eubacteriales bacterium]|nr:glycosyltransferase family 39 protein [Eubacteriales bacterium]
MKKPYFDIHDPDHVIFLVIAAAFVERLIMFFWLGSGALNDSDDVGYVQCGIEFARSGTISMWSAYPTALIMPAMPVVTGIFSMIFGEGNAYIDAVRICWIILGCITVYFFYASSCFFVRKWLAVLASCAFLLPNWAWSDNAFLTEPPYLLFWMINFYYSLLISEDETADKKHILCYVLSFMAALMFRANILTMPLFTAVYLFIIKKRKLRTYLPHLIALISALLIFIVPWSVRNYRLFDEFIPLTSGSANPLLLGTYQGSTAPSDDTLDYETNVYSVIREEYAEYFGENGLLKDPIRGAEIANANDKLKAQYRLREWFKRDPKGLIWSYLFSKPACMLNWVWCWLPIPALYYTLHYISMFNLILCVLAVVLSLVLRKKRPEVLFLSVMYLFNIYTFAFSFASERYAAMSVPIRYIIAVIGIEIVCQLAAEKKFFKVESGK